MTSPDRPDFDPRWILLFAITFAGAVWVLLASTTTTWKVLLWLAVVGLFAVMSGRRFLVPTAILLAAAFLTVAPEPRWLEAASDWSFLLFLALCAAMVWVLRYPAAVRSTREVSFVPTDRRALDMSLTPEMGAKLVSAEAWLATNGFESLGPVRHMEGDPTCFVAFRHASEPGMATVAALPRLDEVWVEFSTVLSNRRGLLETSPVPGFFAIDPVLRQHVHHAGPDVLWPLHVEALRRLEQRGIHGDRAAPELIDADLQLFMPENRAFTLRRPLTYGFVRSGYERHGRWPYSGPVWERPDFEHRLQSIRAA